MSNRIKATKIRKSADENIEEVEIESFKIEFDSLRDSIKDLQNKVLILEDKLLEDKQDENKIPKASNKG